MRSILTNWALVTGALLILLTLPRSGAAVGDLELLSRSNVPPNVMLFLDNSGSMRSANGASTRIEVAGGTLVNLIDSVNPDPGSGTREQNVRFGLARFPVGQSAYGGIPGSPYWNGCVGSAVAGEIATGNDDTLITTIQGIVTDVLPPNNINADGTCLSEALVDIGRYMSGGEGFSAYPGDLTQDRTLDLWIEPNPRIRTTKTMEPVCPGGACPSPMDLECRQNFAIVITDGFTAMDEHDHYGADDPGSTANSTFLSTIGNADGDQNECDPNQVDPNDCTDQPSTGRDDATTYGNLGTDWLDDVAHYLNQTDFKSSMDGTQNIVTYTVGFDVNDNLLGEAAAAGGGIYFQPTQAAQLAADLEAAIADIIDQSQASFSGATVPGGQIGLGNALYNSFFTSSNEPVWDGHLEALHISPTGQIQDKFFAAATDASGALLSTRVPFWDAGEELKTNTTRTLYTSLTGAAGAPDDFDKATITAAHLGVVLADAPTFPNYPASGVDTLAELEDAVVDYIHGKDAFDEDGDADLTNMRSIVLGDIFHSEPRAIGAPTRLTITEQGYSGATGFFNLYKDRDRVVYVGANDGMLHAFNAGQFTLGDDATTPELEFQHYTPGSGAELWGYVPGHQLSRVSRVPRNSPRSDFFVDAAPTVVDAWLGDIKIPANGAKDPEEWATIMIGGYREGGSGYYALDITDPGAVSGDPHFPYPSLLWEFSDADLGESWSEAVVTRIKLRTASGGDKCGFPDGDGDCREQWVAIFGGGYAADGDPNRNSYIEDPANAAWSDTSKAIYMVALDTGAILAKVEFDATDTNGPDEMKFSLPSTPAVLDLNFDGFADVVYIGDLGGQVWKWDMHDVGEDTDADPLIDNWNAGIFFSTPRATTAVGDPKHYRSFFYPPVGSLNKGKLTLAFGSGERHDLSYPGDTGVADENNRFYVVEDAIPFGALSIPLTPLTDTDLTNVTALDTDNLLTDKGYRFDVAEGEKFVTNITVFAGYVIVGSYTPVPTANLCVTASGQAFAHIFKLSSGKGFYDDPLDPPSEDRRTALGGGLPSDPTVTVSKDPSDDKILIKTSEGPRVLAIDAPPRTDPTGSLIYWRQQL